MQRKSLSRHSHSFILCGCQIFYNKKESSVSKLPSTHHSFDIRLATSLGVDAAIFVHHISYWLEYNERMKKNFKEDRYWTYQTLSDLHGHFPYWSIDQLRHLIKKLTTLGILIKGNFNENRYDQTMWYTLDFSKIPTCMWENSQIDAGNIPTRIGENPKPIPDNKTNNKENIYIAFGSFVKFSQEQYDALIKQHGKDLVDDIIQCINDHCVNKNPKGYKDYEAAFRNFLRNRRTQYSGNSEQLAKANDFEKNKRTALVFENTFKSSTYDINIGNSYIEFTPKTSQAPPIQIHFACSESAFKEQLDNASRKYKFEKGK